MIYLIGGPIRCGKTTLAKKFAKFSCIPWISTDALEVVTREYVKKSEWERKYPYTFLRRKGAARNNDTFYATYSPKKIILVLKKQAQATKTAIEIFVANEIANGNDYILEGYHLTPQIAHGLINKYGKKNIRAVFLIKNDKNKFAKDVRKSSTPNDWLLVLTKKEGTFLKVGEMVAEFSKYFEAEAKKSGLRVFNMDKGFNQQAHKALKYLKN